MHANQRPAPVFPLVSGAALTYSPQAKSAYCRKRSRRVNTVQFFKIALRTETDVKDQLHAI